MLCISKTSRSKYSCQYCYGIMDTNLCMLPECSVEHFASTNSYTECVSNVSSLHEFLPTGQQSRISMSFRFDIGELVEVH